MLDVYAACAIMGNLFPRTSNLREFAMNKKAKHPKKRLCKGVSQQQVACEAPAQRRCTQCSLWFCRIHFQDPDWHHCAPDQGTG